MNLPSDYIIQKFMAYGGRPRYVASTHAYNAACPVCREGKSWTKKRRLYYIPKDNFLLCYNCNRSWFPPQWVHEVTGLSYDEIKEELQEGNYYSVNSLLSTNEDLVKKINLEVLPYDSINLCDPQQLLYYKGNKVVDAAQAYIKERRLDTAINKPNKFYISLKDFVHKDRLVIPFEDPDHQTRFYQTRALFEKDEEIAKYLSKFNADKTIYGLNNIRSEPNYLFLFEGPIDSFFVINGLGITGLKLTEHQKRLLAKYMFFNKIWVLDNDLETVEVKDQYKTLIDEGETVFIWPDKYKNFKDLNQLCVGLKLDKINPEFFINNAFKGHEASTRL